MLDVGCGKGFLLYEMLKLQPGLKIAGFDVSGHGLANVQVKDLASRPLHSLIGINRAA